MQVVLLIGALFLVIFLTAAITTIFVRRQEVERMGEYQDKILRTQREEVQTIYRTMRGWRHDYHNLMQKMKAHLALGQIPEVLDYLDQLEQDLDEIDIAIKTGNVTVDAILSSKLSVAAGKQIEINCKAKVPEKLSVSDVDLCVILGNLIDNGVDSCERMEETDRKFIRVYIGIFKEQLYLSVMNSTKEKKRRKEWEFVSSKRGSHGFGLGRIDQIVDKYEGYINRKNEPGAFATEIMLPL